MAENKTLPTETDPLVFLNSVEHPQRRADGLALYAIMKAETGLPPVLWGDSMVGYGRYRYRYASGREGEWPVVAFSPRKQSLTLYLTQGAAEYGALLAGLGKHKTGVGCVYINKLADVDEAVLRELIRTSMMQAAEVQQPD
jgi:hypothetical protein